MNDRIHDLLVREADGLDIPAPPTRAILAAYKTARRRRRVITGLGAVAAVTVLGVAANFAAGALTSDDASGQFAGTGGARGEEVAYAQIAGYLDTEGRFHEINVPAEGISKVWSLSYSSEGLVATHENEDAFMAYSLVAPDGSVTETAIDPVKDGAGSASDPDEPYLAVVRMRQGKVTVVVHDLAADREVAHVAVAESAYPGEKYHQFQVSYSDGQVYVRELGGDSGTNGPWYVVDWRSGDVRQAPELADAISVEGGRAVLAPGGDETAPRQIVDLVSGDSVLEISRHSVPVDVQLAPDGRHALVKTWLDEGIEVEMHVLATGERHRLPELSSPAWSEGSDIAFQIDRDGRLVTCDLSGQCDRTKIDMPNARSIGVELPGTMGYEF
jgi:hypothetical protein